MNSKLSRSSHREGTKPQPITKVPSGVSGLDEILEGGFPGGRATLLSGGPGTGKSMLALEFLYRGAWEGRAGIFVAFEERAESIRRNALARGWDLAALEQAGKLSLLEARVDRDAILAGTFNIKPILAIIEGQARKMNAACIVVDAVDVFMRIFKDHEQEREELYGLHDWLLENRFTALITAKRSDSDCKPKGYDFLDYMADCAISLDQRVDGQITTRRIRVLKYRGSGYIPNECPFLITPRCSVVMPVSGVSLDYPSSGDRISTGIERLDRLSGGGYQCGATALISGATGTGKTTLVCSFVREACARDEKVLYVSFEESASILISNMLSPGIDLRPAAQTGHLEFLARMPESVGVEQHLYDVLQGIEEFQPEHVVVDAISACHRMGSERAAFDYLVRLINMARDRGLTLVMTNQLTHNNVAGDVSDFGIASLVDTIVILRYADRTEAVGRILQIYKNRGSKHSNGRHQYSITDDGIDIHDGAGQGMSTTEPSERQAEGPVR